MRNATEGGRYFVGVPNRTSCKLPRKWHFPFADQALEQARAQSDISRRFLEA